MKMDYTNSNCERTARELLAPLSGACPESIWENITIELEARRKATENKWINRISNAPRTPIIVAASVVVVTIGLSLILSHKSSASNVVTDKNSVTSENNAIAASSVPTEKKNITTQPVAIVPTALTQPVIAQPAKRNQQNQNAKVDPKNQVTTSQSKAGDKDDDKPILIHNADGPQIVTTEQPSAKGVAVDLEGSRDTSSMHSIAAPSADAGDAIQDPAQ